MFVSPISSKGSPDTSSTNTGLTSRNGTPPATPMASSLQRPTSPEPARRKLSLVKFVRGIARGSPDNGATITGLTSRNGTPFARTMASNPRISASPDSVRRELGLDAYVRGIVHRTLRWEFVYDRAPGIIDGLRGKGGAKEIYEVLLNGSSKHEIGQASSSLSRLSSILCCRNLKVRRRGHLARLRNVETND